MIISSFLPSLSSFDSHTRRTPKRPHLHSQRGLTAIEMVVVLGMTGVLMAVSFVDFGKLIDQFNLDNATRDVVAVLNDARSQAVTQGETRVVSYNPITKKIIIINPDNIVVAEKKLPARVSLSLSSNVTFTSLGTLPVQDSSTSFSLNSSAGGRTLMIRRTGKVDVS